MARQAPALSTLDTRLGICQCPAGLHSTVYAWYHTRLNVASVHKVIDAVKLMQASVAHRRVPVQLICCCIFKLQYVPPVPSLPVKGHIRPGCLFMSIILVYCKLHSTADVATNWTISRTPPKF